MKFVIVFSTKISTSSGKVALRFEAAKCFMNKLLDIELFFLENHIFYNVPFKNKNKCDFKDYETSK